MSNLPPQFNAEHYPSLYPSEIKTEIIKPLNKMEVLFLQFEMLCSTVNKEEITFKNLVIVGVTNLNEYIL